MGFMGMNIRHLVVILVVFRQVSSLNGVPITRTQGLLQERHHRTVLLDNDQQTISEGAWKQEVINGNADLENRDYPEFWSNHHHMPKLPPPSP